MVCRARRDKNGKLAPPPKISDTNIGVKPPKEMKYP